MNYKNTQYVQIRTNYHYDFFTNKLFIDIFSFLKNLYYNS